MEVNSLVYWMDALKAFSGFAFGIFAMIIYWKVKNEGDLAMSSFQLNEGEVIQDYKIILYGNIMVLIGFVFNLLASLGIVSVLIWKIISTGYILMIMFVLVRWVRLFR